MKTKLILAVAVLALSACSTNPFKGNAAQDSKSTEAIRFTQDFGKVEVTFNDKGEWESLKSSATSSIPINADAGLEQGMNVALLRAKRNISEFITQDLKSKTTSDTITKSLTKNDSDESEKQRAESIAQDITEKIAVESVGILKGIYILERKLSSDGKYVVVTVQVDKQSMTAAKQIRMSMGN